MALHTTLKTSKGLSREFNIKKINRTFNSFKRLYIGSGGNLWLKLPLLKKLVLSIVIIRWFEGTSSTFDFKRISYMTKKMLIKM